MSSEPALTLAGDLAREVVKLKRENEALAQLYASARAEVAELEARNEELDRELELALAHSERPGWKFR